MCFAGSERGFRGANEKGTWREAGEQDRDEATLCLLYTSDAADE